MITNSIKELDYEIVTINDFSKDNSPTVINGKIAKNNKIKLFNNTQIGLGSAINLGINKSTGDAVCIMMADMSDEISDLKKYYQLIQEENISAVFGSRFIKGSRLSEYPMKKPSKKPIRKQR